MGLKKKFNRIIRSITPKYRLKCGVIRFRTSMDIVLEAGPLNNEVVTRVM
jgi:hypothetical protein